MNNDNNNSRLTDSTLTSFFVNKNQGNELHVLLNRNGQIVRISDSMIYFTEIPQTEIIGKPWFEIFIPP